MNHAGDPRLQHPAQAPRASGGRNQFTELLRANASGEAPRSAPVAPPHRPPAKPRLSGRARSMLIVASILMVQIAGTLSDGWTPGLFFHGGLDRIIDFAQEADIPGAIWLQRAMAAVLCAYWAVLFVAASSVAAHTPPVPVAGETRWTFQQRRAAYAPPAALLLACHLAGAIIAGTGWWVLALPFELGGHLAMAALLYVVLVPEGRRTLVIIEDQRGSGGGSRIHLSGGLFGSQRRWLTVPRDFLRRVEMLDPLWARVLNTAHIEISYLDSGLNLRTQIVRGMGSKRDIAFISAKLSGQNWRPRTVMHGFPTGVPGGRQPRFRYDEDSGHF